MISISTWKYPSQSLVSKVIQRKSPSIHYSPFRIKSILFEYFMLAALLHFELVQMMAAVVVWKVLQLLCASELLDRKMVAAVHFAGWLWCDWCFLSISFGHLWGLCKSHSKWLSQLVDLKTNLHQKSKRKNISLEILIFRLNFESADNFFVYQMKTDSKIIGKASVHLGCRITGFLSHSDTIGDCVFFMRPFIFAYHFVK